MKKDNCHPGIKLKPINEWGLGIFEKLEVSVRGSFVSKKCPLSVIDVKFQLLMRVKILLSREFNNEFFIVTGLYNYRVNLP